MRFLRQSTATVIETPPLIDDTDGKTPEDALTVASIDVQLMQPLDSAAVPPDRATNGAFGSDTGWTKNSWTISGGVANATTVSDDLEQTPSLALVENVAYELVFDLTRSAGDVTPKIGGTSGTTRSSASEFTETIIAGSGSLIEFTGSGFTGTLDNVVYKQVPISITPAASGSANDMVLIRANTGAYWLELTANQLAIVGRHRIQYFISGALIAWEDFMVIEEAVWDAMYASGAVGPLSAAAVNAECDTAISDASLATAANLATVDGKLPAALVSGRMNSNVSALDDESGAAIRMSRFFLAGRHGVAQGGTSGTITLAPGAVTNDDFFNGSTVVLSANTGRRQFRLITDSVAATDVATITPDWIINPDDSTEYVIIPFGLSDAVAISGAVAAAESITEARMAELDAGNLPTDIAAIPTTAMRGTDNALLAASINLTGGAVDVVTTLTGHTAQTGDNFARLGAPAGASVSADLAAVKADTVLPEKNQAFANIPVLMVASSDHVTPKTGLTVTVQRSLDGAAYGNATGSIAEVSNGTYQFDASAADMNADSIMFKFSGTDADDVFLTVFTR